MLTDACCRAKRLEEEAKAEALERRHEELVPRVMAENQSAHAIKSSLDQMKREKDALVKRKVHVVPLLWCMHLADSSRRQESLNVDITKLEERREVMEGRVVRSPERIRKNISTMGSTVAEDKRIIAHQENRIRELQAKQSVLLLIEKVCFNLFARALRTKLRTYNRK